jgi:hypothetical protein
VAGGLVGSGVSERMNAERGGRAEVEARESEHPRLQALVARIWARHLREQAEKGERAS